MIDTPDVPRGLIYADDHDPGLRRVSGPAGFSYQDESGRAVTDAATLDRIRALVIPPAWTQVWICPDPRGHIQATGRDARRRKQYRYHSAWRSTRDEAKFERVAPFGRALPRLRRRVDADLRRRGLPREKVLALVVGLLEATLIRVGNDEYARANQSYGLTTLLKRHVTASRAGGVFEFRGKSGRIHRTTFRDRRLARVIRACQDLRGQRLFKYVDEAGEARFVTSGDVNDYIRAAIGDGFTAKDFRTWFGTLAAGRALAETPRPESDAGLRAEVARGVKVVAGLLGNTPAVCRKAYIHPAVIEAWTAGRLPLKPASRGRAFELALVRFLERTG